MVNISEIKTLSFGYGALFSEKVNVEWKDGKIHYSYNQFGKSQRRYDEMIYKKIIEATHKEIIDFLIACDAANVREWDKHTYNNEDILDGMSWSIHIEIILDEDGEKTLYKVDVSGYAMYPDTYGEIYEAVEKLISESMYSDTYNAEVLKIFMEDKTKGEEKRRTLFKRITPMVLEIIEKRIDIEILDFDVREILMKYMQQAQYFAQEIEDVEIFNHFIITYHGENNDEIIDLTNYFDEVMMRSFTLRGFAIFEE